MKRIALSLLFGIMLISSLAISSPAEAREHNWNRGYSGAYAQAPMYRMPIAYGGGFFHHMRWHRGC
jgi:hypothetical protein